MDDYRTPEELLEADGIETIRFTPTRPQHGGSADLAAFLSVPHWLERELEPPEPLLGEIITNSTRMFIGGPTGLGKTHLCMGLAAGMATGRGFLHWRASRRSRVLYIDGEMARDLVQERLADVRRRMGDADLSTLFVLCREDCEEIAKRFPGLGSMEPLNTEAGQAFLLRLVDMLGGVDALFFDNRMSLLSGDMKEEQPWTDTMPFVKELTTRRIAQVWVDHTGHNTGQLYGTKTKEWQFDAVALLTKAERPGLDIAFTLEFTKARRRKPSNRADFETVTLTMAGDEWEAERAGADAAEARPGKLNDEAVSLLRHARDLFAAGQGRTDTPEPGMPSVPTLSRKVLHAHLVQRGWLLLPGSGERSGSKADAGVTPQKLPDQGTGSGIVPDAEYKRLYKRLEALQNKGLLCFNRHSVWLPRPVELP